MVICNIVAKGEGNHFCSYCDQGKEHKAYSANCTEYDYCKYLECNCKCVVAS